FRPQGRAVELAVVSGFAGGLSQLFEPRVRADIPWLFPGLVLARICAGPHATSAGCRVMVWSSVSHSSLLRTDPFAFLHQPPSSHSTKERRDNRRRRAAGRSVATTGRRRRF